jgi:hypothetical protein
LLRELDLIESQESGLARRVAFFAIADAQQKDARVFALNGSASGIRFSINRG